MMNSVTFGRQLRIFRQQCFDSKESKGMSQQKLGELLGKEIGDYGFSGAAISDWERGKSKINVNDRLVLTSLIKILKQYGGIKNLTDANLLLEAGNYRALNTDEREKIFPEDTEQTSQQDIKTTPRIQIPNFKFLLSSMFLISPTDVEKILAEANEGPSPKWVHVAVAFIHKGTSRWDIFHVLRIVLWVWVWLLAYVLISPSLQWPFHPEGALYILVRYGIGSMVVPLFVGAMVNTKDQVFWQEREISNTVTMRLYVYQGAYIGFHVGYFFLIPFAALQNQFHIQLNIWVEMLKMIIPIFIGYSGAQLVPYNLWRAYKQLNLKEGAIFFVFAIFGPAWAWFFLKFNQTIGVFTILTAITLLTSAMAIQYQRKGNTVIPLLWIVIFYGFILICQLISFLIK